MILGAEGRRHSALFVRAPAEGNTDQGAIQVVGPLMIGADQMRRVATMDAAELGAAMGATVLDHRDRAVLATRDQHRNRADMAALEVARIGNLDLERHVIPSLAAKDALDLKFVDVLAGIDPVGNSGCPLLRPNVGLRNVRWLRRGHAHRSLLPVLNSSVARGLVPNSASRVLP